MGFRGGGIRRLRSATPLLFRERAISADIRGCGPHHEIREYRSRRRIWFDQRQRQSDFEIDTFARSAFFRLKSGSRDGDSNGFGSGVEAEDAEFGGGAAEFGEGLFEGAGEVGFHIQKKLIFPG